MAQRSFNSHQLRLRELPFFARLKRDDPFYPAEVADWQAAAGRIAGPAGWYARAGWKKEADFKLIHFATQAEADAMQRWVEESGIETRPAPGKIVGPQLTVGSYNK